jgi:DNA modification methylase
MFIVNSSPVISAPEKPSKEDSTRWPIPFHIFNLCEKVGFKYIDDIQWVKPEGAAPNRNGAFFQLRKPVMYKPNTISEAILVMQKPTCKVSDVLKKYKGDILEQSLVADGYERSNVWQFNPETASKHTAPYPLALTDRVVKYYSFVGDTVLDPFSGSGTTGVSAVTHNRAYVGCEMHQEYVDMATERIQRYDNSLANLL